MNYAKTSIPDFISVRSIMTVFHITLDSSHASGEAHYFPEIIYIERGSHKILVGGELYALREGQMMIYAPYSYHIGAEPSDALVGIVSFEVESDILPKFYNRVITLGTEQRALFKKIISAGTEAFKKVPSDSGLVGMTLQEGVNEYVLQKLKNQLEMFLIDVCQNESLPDTDAPKKTYKTYREKEFAAVCEYIGKHLCEPLSLERIAEDCSMSVSKLKVLFREHSNDGVIAYIINRRIEAAKRMIRDDTYNFTEISAKLGFGSVHYFSRLFKKKVGMSPSEYAKKQ